MRYSKRAQSIKYRFDMRNIMIDIIIEGNQVCAASIHQISSLMPSEKEKK